MFSKKTIHYKLGETDYTIHTPRGKETCIILRFLSKNAPALQECYTAEFTLQEAEDFFETFSVELSHLRKKVSEQISPEPNGETTQPTDDPR